MDPPVSWSDPIDGDLALGPSPDHSQRSGGQSRKSLTLMAEAGVVQRSVDDDLAADAVADGLVDDEGEAAGAFPVVEVGAVGPPWALQRRRHIPSIIENRSLPPYTSAWA